MSINLKEIRKSKKLTQAELAHLLGIKQQQYQRYESGNTKLPLDTLEKILEICEYKLKIVKERKKDFKKENGVLS